MGDLSTLTPAHFESLPDDMFIAESGPGEVPLQLDSVQRHPARGQGRVPFSVFWLGPKESPILPQGIHALRHPELGEMELFLVPVEMVDGRVRYQAVFA
jgi:hypothetical protein